MYCTRQPHMYTYLILALRGYIVSICTALSLSLPPEASLSPPALLPAVSTVTKFWGDKGLLTFLDVPFSVQDQIRESASYSSEDEKRSAGLKYYLETVPGASWMMVAGTLWYMEEEMALQEVRKYLPQKRGEYILWCCVYSSSVSGNTRPCNVSA